MATARYVCPECGATVERPFRTASVMRTCENGCAFDHHVREDLLARIEDVPASERPDDWAELSVKERLFVAMRAGVVSRSDL
ncbi:hypothetical protein [Halomarina litorea]|uniref:hypothetical protein n=1 Tax=Halomarina litorea TaxID=2961595 RepID=UPI0020C39A22|nr:hypothetical protein [Halomarina sp. BCD28]